MEPYPVSNNTGEASFSEAEQVMTADEGLDMFRLKSMKVQAGDQASSSGENMINNYLDLAYFEVMTGYTKECLQVRRRILSTLNSDDRCDAVLLTNAASIVVNPSDIRPVLLDLIPNEHYKGLVGNVENALKDRQKPSQSVRWIINQPPVFSDEASLLGVFGKMLGAVNFLVQRMTGSNTLSIRGRGIPLGPVFPEGADKATEKSTGATSQHASQQSKVANVEQTSGRGEKRSISETRTDEKEPNVLPNFSLTELVNAQFYEGEGHLLLSAERAREVHYWQIR